MEPILLILSAFPNEPSLSRLKPIPLEAYDRLSSRQKITLLKSVQSQTILLEHLLDEMAGHLARLDKKPTTDVEIDE